MNSFEREMRSRPVVRECPCHGAKELQMMGGRHKRMVVALRVASAALSREACVQECAAVCDELRLLSLQMAARSETMARESRPLLGVN